MTASDVVFTDPAIDDLRRIGPDVAPRILKRILLLLENPEVVRLGEVVDRLGALTDHLHVDEPPAREPVPDWLADRLIYTVGMTREEVAALDLERAVDLWAEFHSNPR
ncbi:hypothetical protein ACFFMN_05095 [Planobispora siamensis]|uniref:Uncharacterized protein n=1 Tax=Planobispora siamensis TaxID=936338 RepID=A0A8J3SCQ3_9ACTN|nr:hypothetical protein [Planobispora siamensis]GIH92261.1 hypothetical protein Psi01_28910 [Planobispora siamensis]